MATYEISSQTTVPQLKDSAIATTLYSVSFSTNIPQKTDLTYGANNNDGLHKYDVTLDYHNQFKPSLAYTTEIVDHKAKVITITNITSLMRNGSYDLFNNTFNPSPVSSSYNLYENLSIRPIFAPSFPIIMYY